MSGAVPLLPKFQFSNNGAPMVNGTVTVYLAGTVTPSSTWQDEALTILNTNPIVLDARGEAVIYLDPALSYKFLLKNAAGVTQWTQDDIKGGGTVAEIALLRADLAASSGASLVGYLPSGVGAIPRTSQSKLRDLPSICDFGAVGDGVTDNYAAINLALAAHSDLYVPPGIYMTSAGAAGVAPHNIKGKSLSGLSRETCIIKAMGTNTGRTLFVNGVTDVAVPGTWGSGGEFRLENLRIRGNWDKTTGLTNVTEGAVTAPVGILKAAYAATQTALIKGVSAAYPFIINCYIEDAYEHGVLFYRTGYTEIAGNIFARCRGSALWLTADSSAAAITSTIVERNQFVANRGGYGAVRTLYTYGCAFRDNRPFEDNTWGATFGEGADTDISGNYFEANPFGDASIDPTLWGLSLMNNYWTIKPTLPPVGGGSTRGYFGYDRKIGLRHIPVGGLGETDNQLGPMRYSCDSKTVGLGGTAPAASGVGHTYPSIQVPSTDPYTLDDYAERSLTITDASGAGLAFGGAVQYTKVGRLVTVFGTLTFPVTVSGAAVSLSGILQVGSADGIGSCADNAGLGASVVRAAAGATTFTILPAGSFAERTNANFSGKVIIFSLQYNAAS